PLQLCFSTHAGGTGGRGTVYSSGPRGALVMCLAVLAMTGCANGHPVDGASTRASTPVPSVQDNYAFEGTWSGTDTGGAEVLMGLSPDGFYVNAMCNVSGVWSANNDHAILT